MCEEIGGEGVKSENGGDEGRREAGQAMLDLGAVGTSARKGLVLTFILILMNKGNLQVLEVISS